MKTQNPALGLAASALLALLGLPVVGAASDSGAEAAFTPSLNLRLRYETAEQDNVLEDARAVTARYRIGLQSRSWNKLRFFAESEGVHALASEDYNSGPGGNGRSNYSVVADPTDTELNQFWLDYAVTEQTHLRAGRQRLIYGDARFMGNVGWRQNEQTYDAVSLQSKWGGSAKLSYAYLSKVNRIFFDQLDLNGHALRFDVSLNDHFEPFAFAYLLDFEAAVDSQTLGLGARGRWPLSGMQLGYSLSYAKQQDYADASSFDVDFIQAELKLSVSTWTFSAGQESLGSDGQQGFATPLATLHKFNGWADVFLSTPANGLVDQYLKVIYTQASWKALLKYHQFDADVGGAKLGSEIDLLLSWKLANSQVINAKLADYRSDGHAVDTRRFTLEWNYRFSS